MTVSSVAVHCKITLEMFLLPLDTKFILPVWKIIVGMKLSTFLFLGCFVVKKLKQVISPINLSSHTTDASYFPYTFLFCPSIANKAVGSWTGPLTSLSLICVFLASC